MNDYDRMAEIIRYLDACQDTQPDLKGLADLIGLSPFHFHRLFSHWVGITPKTFLQCLTLETAKRSLLDGQSVLDAAIDSGLSGPGRLHDLCLKLEAASPGEIKSGGHGLDFTWGIAPSPFGQCFVAWTNRGLHSIQFVDHQEANETVTELREAWPKAHFSQDDSQAETCISEVFQMPFEPNAKPLSAWVRATPFQVRVWRALLDVPLGHLTSYSQIARAIGQAKAARAVGTAIGSNPLAYLIPCHRVIRETGVIGNYRWRHGRKRSLIACERAIRGHFPARST